MNEPQPVDEKPAVEIRGGDKPSDYIRTPVLRADATDGDHEEGVWDDEDWDYADGDEPQ